MNPLKNVGRYVDQAKTRQTVGVLHVNLINCDKNYNDELEKIKTHPDCLSKVEDIIEGNDNTTF